MINMICIGLIVITLLGIIYQVWDFLTHIPEPRTPLGLIVSFIAIVLYHVAILFC